MASRDEDATECTIGPIIIKPRGRKTDRSVMLINTGGTIGMKLNSYGSLESSSGFLAERLVEMRELQRADVPSLTLYEVLPLLDSSNMGPREWVRIAELIQAHYFEHDAFVVIMGTDTMAYAASALSFVLENLDKTVIMTGSMLPLSDLLNDAQRNLIVSIVMAATLNIPEVCIFMDDQLLRGNRTVKTNSSGLDSFDSPNFPPLAKLEIGIRVKAGLALAPPMGRFTVHTSLNTNVAVWKMVPGFSDEYIVNSITHAVELRAIVLELYGTGNLPNRKASLISALERAVEKGIAVVASSQCLRGTVDLRAYELGRRLEQIGVISGGDMTTEAIATKLAYLLSWPGMTLRQLRHYMGKSLRGEVTEGRIGGAEASAGQRGPSDVRLSMSDISGPARMEFVAGVAAGPTGSAVLRTPGDVGGYSPSTATGPAAVISSPLLPEHGVAALPARTYTPGAMPSRPMLSASPAPPLAAPVPPPPSSTSLSLPHAPAAPRRVSMTQPQAQCVASSAEGTSGMDHLGTQKSIVGTTWHSGFGASSAVSLGADEGDGLATNFGSMPRPLRGSSVSFSSPLPQEHSKLRSPGGDIGTISTPLKLSSPVSSLQLHESSYGLLPPK